MAIIYLLEDSPLYLKLLGDTLQERNDDVHRFENAPSLLDALAKNVPDLIVSDIVMPEMTGFELCAKIRKQYSKEELPILLISCLDTMEDIARGYEAGANDYLVKSNQMTEFPTRVALLLE